MRLNGSKSVYEEGVISFNVGNYKRAKDLFKIVINDPEYREIAMYKLYKVYLKLGMYNKVREDLRDSNILKDEMLRIRLLASLDSLEYNYGRSLELYNYLIEKGRKNYLFNLTDLHINLGEFDKAFDDIREAFVFTNDKVRRSLNLARLYLLEGKYELALNVLDAINKKTLSRANKRIYEKLKIMALYHLERDPKSFAITPRTQYVVDLLSGKEEILKHRIADLRFGDIRFNYDINVDELIKESRKLMEDTNNSFLYYLSVYKGFLPKAIGVNRNKKINGIIVSTLVNTDKISSIFPVDFSSEFDMEGYKTSDELRKSLKIK